MELVLPFVILLLVLACGRKSATGRRCDLGLVVVMLSLVHAGAATPDARLSLRSSKNHAPHRSQFDGVRVVFDEAYQRFAATTLDLDSIGAILNSKL